MIKKNVEVCHMKRVHSVLLPFVFLLYLLSVSLIAGTFSDFNPVDQTPTKPLANPTPSGYQPRYLSGFGEDENFTVFFEDRDNGGKISYVTTENGPLNFETSPTETNITDTHFLIKEWPIEINGTTYAYRGWGAVGNNADHRFYVSNNLTDWSLISTFTIPNAASFSNARGTVYYGFHDVIELNSTYYAFGESNGGQTMIVRSANGDDSWEAFASVGGNDSGDGPLLIPSTASNGWTPRGNFFDLGNDKGIGKLYCSPDDDAFYLAVNTAVKASLSPSQRAAAFIDPDNWTWNDDTNGSASNPIMSKTTEHDLREGWVVPRSDPSQRWILVYDADYGSADGGKALGYASILPQPCDGVMKRLDAYHWVLIGFPCDTGSNGIGDLLGASLGSYGNDWVIYEQSGTDDYIGNPNTIKRRLESNDTVIPGKGYWIISAADKNMSIDTNLSGLSRTAMQAASNLDINDSAFDDLNLTLLPDSNQSGVKKVMLGNPFQHKMQLSELYFSHAAGSYHAMGSSTNDDYIDSTVYTYDYNGTSADNYVAVTPDTPGFSDRIGQGVGFFIKLESNATGTNKITYPFEK